VPNNIPDITRPPLLIGAVLAVLMLAIFCAGMACAADDVHLPKQFHGLWCGVQSKDDDRNLLTRARGKTCPSSSADNFVSMTADGFEYAEGQCRVLVTMPYRQRGDYLSTFYCWGEAGRDKGWTNTYWLAIIDGQLSMHESERRP
jgi:hypothetical protein